MSVGAVVVGVVARVAVLCMPNDKCCNPAFLTLEARHVYCGPYDVGLGPAGHIDTVDHGGDNLASV